MRQAPVGDGTFSGRVLDITSSMTGAMGCAFTVVTWGLRHGNWQPEANWLKVPGSSLGGPFDERARAAMRKRQAIALPMIGR